MPVSSRLADYYADMNPEDFELYMSLVRTISPAEKIAAVFRMNEMFWQLVEKSVRRQFPDVGEREVFLRTAARHLDSETMIRVYGWDPNC